MSLYSESWKYIRLEARAERRAVLETDETSYIEILRASGQPTEWPSWETDKGRKIEASVRAQDIFNQKTWEKFLSSKGKQDSALTSLTDDCEAFIEAYDAFLEEKHTERYRMLDPEGKLWRRLVVAKAVTWHILRNKLNGYLKKEDTFADERVAYYLKMTRAIKTLLNECARMNHHIVKDPELSKSELAKFFALFYEQFQSIPFQQRDELMRLMGIDEEEGDKEQIA